MSEQSNVLKYFEGWRQSQMPYMARHSYVHELRAMATFPLAISLTEGGLAGVIAAKTFDASATLVAVITAAPMFGNITALVWTELSRGRPKVPFVNLLQLGVVLAVMSIALLGLLPKETAGYLFALQIVLVRVLVSGIITVRASIWRANYPAELRAQITSRLATVNMAIIVVISLLAAVFSDLTPNAYLVVYPLAGLLGAVGMWQFSKIKVRRETLLIRSEIGAPVGRPEDIDDTGESLASAYSERTAANPARMIGNLVRLLRDDPFFRRYQMWQATMGVSFMMMIPAKVFMVSTQLTNPDEDYTLATLVVQVIPPVVAIIAIYFWAQTFDRLHIIQFRLRHGVAVFLTHTLMFVAGVGFADTNPTAALVLVAASAVLQGVSMGGGQIAWNLGHNAFTDDSKASAYMGAHVVLTGVRGCLAPFLGVGLYVSVLEEWVFGVSMLLAAIAWVGFLTMRHQMKRDGVVPTT